MTQDEYAVDETPAEYSIARRTRPARMIAQRVKTETLERARKSEEIDRGLLPHRQPERH